jgi:hypothetical protein
MKDETREQLLRSKELLSWSLEPVPEPKPAGVGRGQTYKYVGKTYKNLYTEEKCYSIPEISKLWNISVDLARDTFADEPGVLKWQRPATKTKRPYSLLRVPESILVRVHRRLTERG